MKREVVIVFPLCVNLSGVGGIPPSLDCQFITDVVSEDRTLTSRLVDRPVATVSWFAQLDTLAVGCHDSLGIGEVAVAISLRCDCDCHCVVPCVCVCVLSTRAPLAIEFNESLQDGECGKRFEDDQDHCVTL